MIDGTWIRTRCRNKETICQPFTDIKINPAELVMLIVVISVVLRVMHDSTDLEGGASPERN